jgi:hypothetical protein
MTLFVLIQLAKQEEACLERITLNRASGYTKHARDVLLRHAAEEAEFYDLAQPLIDSIELPQSVVQLEDLVEFQLEADIGIAKRDGVPGAAALGSAPAPGEVDQHLPHGARGGADSLMNASWTSSVVFSVAFAALPRKCRHATRLSSS